MFTLPFAWETSKVFVRIFNILEKGKKTTLQDKNPYSDLCILLTAHLYGSTFYIFYMYQVNCLSSPRLSTPEERGALSYTPPCAQSLVLPRTHNMLSTKAYWILDWGNKPWAQGQFFIKRVYINIDRDTFRLHKRKLIYST